MELRKTVNVNVQEEQCLLHTQMQNFKQTLMYVCISTSIHFLYTLNLTHSLLFQRRRQFTHTNAKSRSEKFPPPHQDGALGYPIDSSHIMDPMLDTTSVPFSSMNFTFSKDPIQTWSGPFLESDNSWRKKTEHTNHSNKNKLPRRTKA